MAASQQNKQKWVPVPGALACYTGRAGRLLRGGRIIQIVAEASTKRMVVRAIGHQGDLVQFTVLTAHLGQPQPGLFDQML